MHPKDATTNHKPVTTCRWRKGRLNPAWATLATGLVLAFAGCSTTRQQTKGTPEVSGFLGDYSQMQLGLKGQAKLVYMRPDLDVAKYTKIWVKHVELWKSDDPNSSMGRISPKSRQTLIDLLNTSLVNALSSSYSMVGQGGPDVLVIHAAITDSKKSKPVAGAVSSVYLPLKVFSLGKQTLFGTGIGVGAITIEAEILDGASNERLAAVVDSRSGTTAIRSKASGTWGDVEKSFDWWAERLRTRLAEEKAKAPVKTPL